MPAAISRYRTPLLNAIGPSLNQVSSLNSSVGEKTSLATVGALCAVTPKQDHEQRDPAEPDAQEPSRGSSVPGSSPASGGRAGGSRARMPGAIGGAPATALIGRRPSAAALRPHAWRMRSSRRRRSQAPRSDRQRAHRRRRRARSRRRAARCARTPSTRLRPKRASAPPAGDPASVESAQDALEHPGAGGRSGSRARARRARAPRARRPRRARRRGSAENVDAAPGAPIDVTLVGFVVCHVMASHPIDGKIRARDRGGSVDAALLTRRRQRLSLPDRGLRNNFVTRGYALCAIVTSPRHSPLSR